MNALESYDLLRFAQQFAERLTFAQQVLSTQPGLDDEKGWCHQSMTLAVSALSNVDALLFRARLLPELLEVRREFASTLQQQWVDALEKLFAGLTFHAGGRAPIIEALLPHQKFQALRRASREAVTGYQADLVRRSKLSYAQRMLSEPTLAFATDVLANVHACFNSWESSFGTDVLAPSDAEPVRQELCDAGKRADQSLRQARLLVEAALIPLPGMFEDHGLHARPKRRSARRADEDTPLLQGLTPSAEEAEQAGPPTMAEA